MIITLMGGLQIAHTVLNLIRSVFYTMFVVSLWKLYQAAKEPMSNLIVEAN